jgi:16S rRNA U516 pseudouridylate synthase RsuA-like enzyme
MRKKLGNSCNLERLFRIDRVLTNRGVGSRKEITLLIRTNSVVVNDEPVHNISKHIPYDSKIVIKGKCVHEVPLIALYHKPISVQSTLRDPWNRSCLDDLYKQNSFLEHMHPVVSTPLIT